MNNVSIEYAHIYSNGEISREHQTAIDALSEVRARLDKAAETYSLVVMVDDYSFPDPTFDYDGYINWLAEKGFKPDYMCRESQLIPLCDDVIGLINDHKLKSKLVGYVRVKRYPCSLFVAAWYLLRLGALKHPAFDEGLAASRLLNILPKSFKPFEDEGLKIIAATNYSEVVGKISYEFIEGRPLV